MARVNINGMKHIERTEEIDILQFVSENDGPQQISLWGMSGVGKTEMALSALNTLHTSDLYSEYTLLHYDANQIADNCTNDIFYSLLIYKLIQKTNSTEMNLTTVTKQNTFLSYLEKSSYKSNVKLNAKKALIASLALLPTIGSQIYEVLKMTDDDKSQNYKTIQYVFREYMNYLNDVSGLIIFIDNIQNIPIEIVRAFFEIIRQSGDGILLFTSYTLVDESQITKKLIEQYKFSNHSLILKIENISFHDFDKICESNMDAKVYYELQQRLDYFYTLVQYGNLREIDELIFQINHSGINNLDSTPTLQGIR